MTTLETSLVERKQQFEARSEAFLAGMPTEGPFIPGLKAKEAARRLEVFLKVFRELDESMSFLTENYKIEGHRGQRRISQYRFPLGPGEVSEGSLNEERA